MSRGDLSDEELLAIHDALPDLIPLKSIALSLWPEIISMKFRPDSRIPEAAVCFLDAVSVAVDARYAAHESAACRLYYTSKVDPPRPETSVFFGKYYLDDAALRLYAAGEHLANAIVCMLDVDEEALNAYQVDRASIQSIVWAYLNARCPHHPVTEALRLLGEPWLTTMRYRNCWVHQGPPTIAGIGIVLRRGNRWQGKPGGPRTLPFNGGDLPEWTIDELADAVLPALKRFTTALHAIVDYYVAILESNGVRFAPNKLSVELT